MARQADIQEAHKEEHRI